MSTHAPTLLATDAALESFELPLVAAPVATLSAGTPLKHAGEVAPTRSFAAAVVREVVEAAEKAQEAGRSHIELRLPSQDSEGLRVHLNWRDGVVHTRFVAQTSEMQHSLSREWEAAAPRFAEKGMKFSEPSFENHGQPADPQSGQSAFASDQQRHRPRGHTPGGDDLPKFTLPASSSAVAPAPARRDAARTTTDLSPVRTDARGLRVWA